MKDGFGRNINYLRLSITDLCNLRCRYCMPERGIDKCDCESILRFEEVDKIVSDLIEMGIDKVRITGGEPLVRRGIVQLIEKIGNHERIKELAITTNGILLEEMAEGLKRAGLNRVNVSLDTLDPHKYKYMTRGGDLKKVQQGIQKAMDVGLTPIKLNCVLIGGFNDDEIRNFVELTRNQAIDVRFIELMPIGEVAKWNEDQFISNDEVLKQVPELISVEKDDPSSPATYYRLPDSLGRVGLIRPISCKFCEDCNRIRLTSDGKLKYCLHSDDELDLKEVLRNQQDIHLAVQTYINKKPHEHQLDKKKYVKKSMFRIGG
ncbi:cyclic pyranopterin monophosphate synthase subunit MoaA [Marinisporobacter balticus]|uniref:GTP 3',8-cyclase n=1 Tax=Marinisporobacter balticus TaxID=2018667 RepID=A0A4R2L118_9FIRM|nr:GTP 3',8-cyclase MoaA [Marinisporobacter balticus]TCO77406.1 cyclic pyranopterin monophosphate synthase subunit MoaA [Marinisporobacter balticus]